MIKKFCKNIHLWLSLPFGIVMSIVCFTGAILVFEQEVTRALSPELYYVEPSSHTRLQPSQIAQAVWKSKGDTMRISSIEYSGDAKRTVLVSLDNVKRKKLSVNPYTGKVLGWTESSSFFRTVKQLHRYLLHTPAAKGEKTVGKVVVGISALCMAFVLLSGLVIWIPRTWKTLKARLQVKVTNGSRRFWHDSHVALGFYALIFLLLMALTGPTWSFSWYRSAAYSLLGAEMSKGGNNGGQSKENGKKDAKDFLSERREKSSDIAQWDNMLLQVKKEYPTYASLTLKEGTIMVAPDASSKQRSKMDEVTFNEKGEIKDVKTYAQKPLSKKAHGLFFALHTGTWSGWLVQWLYFFAAIIGGTLPLTGYYIWWKRTCKK